MRQIPLHSQLIVISWWSNCLALACLHRLLTYTENRNLFVIQVGKSQEQRDRFLKHLPREITVLPYTLTSPAEHSRVLHNIVFRQMSDAQGVWLIDHDTLFQENLETWLCATDRILSTTEHCLAVPYRKQTVGGITSPCVWMSPQRWPQTVNNFDPIPFAVSEQSRRPDYEYPPTTPQLPEADTLECAKETLDKQGRVEIFPLSADQEPRFRLPSPPPFEHYGGLPLLSSSGITHHQGTPWMRRSIRRLSKFYQNCPPSWIAAEDPVLLQRLRVCQTLRQRSQHYITQWILRVIQG